MKKLLKYLAYTVGVMTITLITMTAIAFTYNIPEETLFGDIYKLGFCLWIFVISIWCGLFFANEFKETK